ncbi:MAG TPA: hypothetical protein GXX20_10290 [Clostridiaceae bacterium]|nr:hypothetical protein [Clostridiaceae bacterium]
MANTSDSYENRIVSKGSVILLIVVGWISAILSLFIYPFIFGLVGVICGILSTKSGSRTGLALIVTSIIFMAIGLIYSGVILNYTRHFLGI